MAHFFKIGPEYVCLHSPHTCTRCAEASAYGRHDPPVLVALAALLALARARERASQVRETEDVRWAVETLSGGNVRLRRRR